jgi:hypothetical protein
VLAYFLGLDFWVLPAMLKALVSFIKLVVAFIGNHLLAYTRAAVSRRKLAAAFSFSLLSRRFFPKCVHAASFQADSGYDPEHDGSDDRGNPFRVIKEPAEWSLPNWHKVNDVFQFAVTQKRDHSVLYADVAVLLFLSSPKLAKALGNSDAPAVQRLEFENSKWIRLI